MFFCNLFTVYLVSLFAIKSTFAEENVLNNEVEDIKHSRNARNFFYVNADSFFKNAQAPSYAPTQPSHFSAPIYTQYLPQGYRIYQLAGYQPLPYMIPVSDEIVSQVTDPVYQNKLHGHKPSTELSSLCKGKRGQFPSPGSCGTFVNCWDGTAVEQECPGGLMFSDGGFCDYAHRVDCGGRPTKVKMPVCAEEFSAFRSTEECGEFFICVNGQPIKFKCPADLHYNEMLGVCDYPHRVYCNVTSTAASATVSSSSEDQAVSTSTSPMSPSDAGEPGMVTSYMAMSRRDALRQIEDDRLRANRPGVDGLHFGHLSQYQF